MSRDRDRLIDDINDWGVVSGTEALADRLIALGWTRLDEERLARALSVTQDYTPDLHRQVYGDDIDWLAVPHEWFDSARNLAAAIAKAYREDADAVG